MKNKISLKESEARILILLSQVTNGNRNASFISAKLNIDYSHTLHLLKRLLVMRWIRMEQYAVKKYYFLTESAPLKEAKELIR